MKRDETDSGYVEFWSEACRILMEKNLRGKELIDALDSIETEHPAEAILRHVTNELSLRPNDETLDEEYVTKWNSLENQFKEASVAFENREISKACWFFYWMGITSQELQAPTSTDWFVARRAEYEKLKRELPLFVKSQNQKMAKEFVQHVAKDLWTTEKCRLTEMANKVWAILVDGKHIEKLEGLPNDANGLKPWLREISPDFAKKRGR